MCLPEHKENQIYSSIRISKHVSILKKIITIRFLDCPVQSAELNIKGLEHQLKRSVNILLPHNLIDLSNFVWNIWPREHVCWWQTSIRSRN